MLGSFPPVFLSENRAEVLQPMVEGARPPRSAPFVGVVGIPEKVVMPVRLPGQLSNVAMVAVNRPEAPRSIGIEIELGLAGGDQLGDRLADPAGAPESVEGKPRGDEEPTNTRHWP